MAYEDVEYSILEALQTIGRGAGLAGLSDAAHRIRELPKVDQDLPADTLPCVIYTPHSGYTSSPMTTENDSNVTYMIEVCLVVGHEGDYASNQKSIQKWHKQLHRAIEKTSAGEFRTSLDGVPSVWSVEIESSPNFDRSLLNSNYAYLSVLVKIQSIE